MLRVLTDMYNRGNLIPKKACGNILQLYEDVVRLVTKVCSKYISDFFFCSPRTGMHGMVCAICYTFYVLTLTLIIVEIYHLQKYVELDGQSTLKVDQ